MAWQFLRTFKQRRGDIFTFTCDIQEDGVSREIRDFSVQVDLATGVAPAAASLKHQVAQYIKLELLARLPAVTTPTIVTLAPEDFA